jgi:hypothetical protein
MSTSLTITCPHCGQSISVDEVLTHQLQDKLKQELVAETSAQTAKRVQEAEAAARTAAEQRFAQQREASEVQLRQLQQDAAEKDRKLQAMSEQELALRREKNQLEERERQLALEVQRQVDAQRQELRTSIAKEIEEKAHFAAAQKDKQLDDMRRQLAEAQRVAQQGSQQSQGEVVELELEQLLARLCPLDTIAPVGKGVNGADIIQTVHDRSGAVAGKIVWELKNTKAWSQGWIAKLKEDQRRETAEIAVLITSVLPDGIKDFGLVDGVWVGSISCVAGLAAVLRGGLLEIATVRQQGENKQEKVGVLYQYLTGVSFSQRVQTVVEAYSAMRESLQKEKLVYTKIWASREKQLESASMAMAGMWGDLEGLMGPALPKIEVLSLDEGADTLE